MRVSALSALVIAVHFLGAGAGGTAAADLDRLVGQPADIAPSAYQYRADRKAEENAPESWLALMRYANQPLNKPVDTSAPAIRQALCGLLWEEIRPVQRLELTWTGSAQRRPAPEDVVITTLDNRGTASSWWNNLAAAKRAIKPTVSTDDKTGTTYVYNLDTPTCGVVISVSGGKTAADCDVPAVRCLVADTWKKMDLEIEWGFDRATADKDYSGRIETYDGAVAGLRPLEGDEGTTAVDSGSWRSLGKGSARRGVKLSLLYMGTSKWRKVQPFISQRDDVARTIVTLWTKAGNFSFLAADLDNGPILAPEYGFFVRRTGRPAPALSPPPLEPRTPLTLLTEKMDNIAGNTSLLGWGSNDTPWFGGNPTAAAVSASGITIPARSVAMHPGSQAEVAAGWRSPVKGTVAVTARVEHAQHGGNGIQWRIVHVANTGRTTLAHGATDGWGRRQMPSAAEAKDLGAVTVEPGDMISLVIGPKNGHQCCTMLVELVISEVGGSGRTWNLTEDVAGSLHGGNPHAGAQGEADVWYFYTFTAPRPLLPSEPPIALASQAASAAEFIKELKARNLSTIRRRIRGHAEQTWKGAVTAMRGKNLPPHPQPPAGAEPAMQVQVPCERLTAQWNLGAWHLVRHCQKNPKTGRLWFDDYPYPILAAETYMILRVLDVMGSHQPAADGFDQWLSVPGDVKCPGPSGLFTDGRGCLTHAVGPGGTLDAVHAFGPGSIGWALTEHYWMTGDTAWLKKFAPRLVANAQWMLRQRQVICSAVPGGERLWSKGLQPPLQVTPDSGGLWMQFYEAEAYYCASLARLAATLSVIDPGGGAKFADAADAYRQDLRAAVDRSIALSPVVPVRDGTFHSVIPFACYVRGPGTGAWGWQRDGSGAHVGPLYWDTVQSAAALISPAGVLSPDDVRVQGYLDVLEDRFLLENANVGNRNWFEAGWQYQGGLERTPNMHLAADDIPVFLRSFLNCYAIDIVPGGGYVFNEHAVHGPPDKIFEEAAFLERFRNLLVMEDGQDLWLARATPRAWLEQGKKISVKNAPTHFGTVAYEIVSDAANGKIAATVEMPSRNPPRTVLLRFRHPSGKAIQSVTVNGKPWTAFDPAKETIRLEGVAGKAAVEASY